MADGPITSIIDVEISVSAINPAQEGFGVPLFLAFHTVGVGGPLVRSYSSLDAIVADGHDMNGAVYSLAAKTFSQRPRPPRVKIGRRTVAWTHVIELRPTVTTAGFVYTFDLALGLFQRYTFSYTVLAGATLTSVGTALAALITAQSGVGGFTGYTFAAVSVAGVITFTAGAPGVVWTFKGLPAAIGIKDVSTAASVAADLTAILAQDRAWYGLAMDQQSGPAVLAVAAIIETHRKVFVTDSSDTDCKDSGSTTDPMYLLRASNYRRTLIQYHPNNGARSAVALMAGRFTAQPGSDTWFGKNLNGVESYDLTDTEIAAIVAKNGNTYLTIAEVGCTQSGVTSAGEFMDIIRGVDWLIARIQERIFRLFLNNPKVAFTDPGIATIVQEIDAQLEIASGEEVKLIVPGSYTIEAPKAQDVDVADRARRVLPNVRFSGDLQGAIHFVGIRGTLTP